MRSRFTPELTGAVLRGLNAGLSLKDACSHAGVPVETVKGWLARGRARSDTPYADFVAAVEGAREVAQATEMSAEEHRAHVNRMVRAGSVSAMKLWWTMHRDELEDGPAGRTAFDALDAWSDIYGETTPRVSNVSDLQRRQRSRQFRDQGVAR